MRKILSTLEKGLCINKSKNQYYYYTIMKKPALFKKEKKNI